MTIEDVVSIGWIIVSALIGFVGGAFYRKAKDMAKDEDSSQKVGEVGCGKNLLDGKPGGAFCMKVDIVDKGNGVEEVVWNKNLLLMNEQQDRYEKFVTDALKKLNVEMDEIRRKYGVFP